ncbi:phage/plasmid primase, P4 family [Sulfitobacter sp. TB366]|uniref:DNA primase family protein n=1 Tax=Sulfitobacter sp. TB366 TaxID=3368580 RepID=UPI0037453FFF
MSEPTGQESGQGLDKVRAAMAAPTEIGPMSAEEIAAAGMDPADFDLSGAPTKTGDASDYDEGGDPEGARFDDMPPHDEPSADDPIEIEGAGLPLNDFGNGQRLTLYYGEDIRFVPRLGWFRWSGTRWAADEDELAVRRDAQQIARRIAAEVPHLAQGVLNPAERDILETWAIARKEYNRLKSKKKDDLADGEDKTLAELEVQAALAAGPEAKLSAARRAHLAHVRASGNSSKIQNMLTEARTACAVSVGQLNRDKLMFNCASGVLKFHAVENPDPAAIEDGAPKEFWRVDILAHERAHHITKISPFDLPAEILPEGGIGPLDLRPTVSGYEESDLCPNFEDFLFAIQPDRELRRFLRAWFGYCLTGLTVEQKMAFFYGAGRNGKSTLMDLIGEIMADYGTTIPIESLTGDSQRKGNEATPDLVRLPGARFVRAAEPEQNTKLREALVKQLTGGEPINIRRMMQEFIEVHPEFKLTIGGNHQPTVHGGDDGIWRRILLIPFATQIKQEDVDPRLPDKLRAEAPGVLAWMVQGCLDYLAHGLPIPETVVKATSDYRDESDKLRAFLLEECLITGGEDTTLARDLIEAFRARQLADGDNPYSKRQCAKKLKTAADTVKRGEARFQWLKTGGDAKYRGIVIGPRALERVAEMADELRRA